MLTKLGSRKRSSYTVRLSFILAPMATAFIIKQETNQCIFCQGGAVAGNKMSKEHFWSDWMSKDGLLPRTPDYVETQRTFRRRTGAPAELFSRSRPGAAATKKIGAVCSRCNNGWMSSLETSAKPWLTSLILGQPVFLDPIAKTIVARWIAMKLFVVEHNRIQGRASDPIFDQEARTAFAEGGATPPGLRIWVAAQAGEKWATGYNRHASGFGVVYGKPTLQPADQEPQEKNIQCVTWGIGKLLVYLHATTDLAVYELLKLPDSAGLEQLWPMASSNIAWPPAVILGDTDADHLTGLLERLLSSEKVIRPWEDTEY